MFWMQSLQIAQPWQADASEHMEIWSVKLCFLHLLPANALLELPQQPGGFHYRLPSRAHKSTLWGAHVFGTKPSQAVPGQACWVKTQRVPSSSPVPHPKMGGLKKKPPREQESFMYGQKKPPFYAQGRINQSHGTETT